MESKATLHGISRDFKTNKPIISFIVDSLFPEADMTGELRLTVRRWRERRSLDANKLFWHCVGEIAKDRRADKWEIYLFLLRRYGKYTYICVKPHVVEAVKKQWREVEEIGEIEINGEKAVQLLCYFGSSTYDTAEVSALLDGTMSEMREMGLTPPADEDIVRSLKEWEKITKKV